MSTMDDVLESWEEIEESEVSYFLRYIWDDILWSWFDNEIITLTSKMNNIFVLKD